MILHDPKPQQKIKAFYTKSVFCISEPTDKGRGGAAPPPWQPGPKVVPFFQILHVPTFKKPCHYF